MASYNLSNQAGAAFRAALNVVLASLHSNSRGPTDPATGGDAVAGMWWVDTGPTVPELKMRNGANSGWITLGTISTTGFDLISDDISVDTIDVTGGIVVGGDVSVAQRIVHTGDTDTQIRFTTDTVWLESGGAVNATFNTAGVQFGGTGARITTIRDEDNMASNSSTSLATQQSIKAYVDAKPTYTPSYTQGDIGTYCFATSISQTGVGFGDTTPGSNLRPTSAAYGASNGGVSYIASFNTDSALSGTWRCMGFWDYRTAVSTQDPNRIILYGSTLWLRIY